MSYKIVVVSCDKNKDLWLPFHLCIEKYWKDHPEIIYSTETLVNPYYKTICRKLPLEYWTKRVADTIRDLPCKHILLTIDDLFIRDYVNNQEREDLCELVRGNIAALNFEFSFDRKDKHYTITKYGKEIYKRNRQGKFKLSCMCQLWQKRLLTCLLECNCTDPWQFEKDNIALDFDFLISKDGNLLNWGKPKDRWQWGIVKGKWTKECKEFLDKEGIQMNYDERGFWE